VTKALLAFFRLLLNCLFCDSARPDITGFAQSLFTSLQFSTIKVLHSPKSAVPSAPNDEDDATPQPGAAMWLKALAGYAAPIFLVLSPITSYADQAFAMHRNKSSAGFSLDIPLIMLVASLLR
jgi:hypothetical protein